ncbi:hypothetical protein FRB90_010765, partial [Tulasnella sp. 427]
MSTLMVNIDTRIRNMFFVDGRFVICGFLNKTSFLLKSDKAIPREICNALSCVLVGYTVLRTVEVTLATLAGVDDTRIVNMQRRLFATHTGHLNTDSLTGRLKTLWRTYIPRPHQDYEGWGTSGTRHNLIYIARKFIKASVLGSDAEAIMDLQAGHSSSVARS